MKRIYVFGLTLSFILAGLLLAQRAGQANSVTFTKDVAPIHGG
jgi:hypothetical protein